jgi:hypothetical protein
MLWIALLLLIGAVISPQTLAADSINHIAGGVSEQILRADVLEDSVGGLGLADILWGQLHSRRVCLS